VPENSAHALVITEAANLKLSMRPTRKLNLLAHYKYDDRNNRTPIDMFAFYDVNMAKAAAASPFNTALGLAPNMLGSNINIFDNRPESKKVNQFDLDADYALGAGQRLGGGSSGRKSSGAATARGSTASMPARASKGRCMRSGALR